MRKVRVATLITVLVLLLTACTKSEQFDVQNVPMYTETPVNTALPSEVTVQEKETTEEPVAYVSETSGFVLRLPGEMWTACSQEQLNRFASVSSEIRVDLTENGEKQVFEQSSEAEFGAYSEKEAASILLMREVYTPMENGYDPMMLQNYMQKHLQAQAGDGLYVTRFSEIGRVLMQNKLYQCYCAAVESKEICQLFVMREDASGEATMVILTAKDEAGALHLLELLDEEARLERVEPDAKAEQINYVCGTWKKNRQSKDRQWGPTYESEFAQLKFRIKSDWLHATDADIADVNGYAYAEGMDLATLHAQNSFFGETYAYDEYRPRTIMVLYENAGDLAAVQPIYYFARNLELSLLEKEGYESLGVTTEQLCGQEYVCICVRDTLEDVLYKHFIRAHGNWIIRVEIYAENEAMMDTLQGWFVEME